MSHHRHRYPFRFKSAVRLLLLLALPALSQYGGITEDQLLLMMQGGVAQQTMMQLQMGAAANQVAHFSRPLQQPDSKRSSDSTLFLYPDSALAIPAMKARLDSLESLIEGDTLHARYERRLFKAKGKQSSLFSSTTSRVGSDYPLKGGDGLVLTVWGDIEKQQNLTVSPEGTIVVEGGGRISVGGLTLEQAANAVKQALGRVYSSLRRGSAQLSLTLSSLSPIKVFVLGEVEVPGGYVFHGNTNVLLALYLANGPSPLGSVRAMQLVRDGKSVDVDLYDFLFYGKTPPEGGVLRDGDVLVLPRAKSLVEVRGDVGREAVYELKEGEGVRELLFYASGLNPTAAEQSAVLERLLEGGRRDFVNLQPARSYIDSSAAPFLLRDGDVLNIPSSTLDAQNNVTVLGAVRYPATYQFVDGMTLEQALAVAGGARDEAYLGRVQVLRSTSEGHSSLYSEAVGKGRDFTLSPSDTVVVYNQRDFLTKDSVSVSGAVVSPGVYPFYKGMTVKDLVLLGGGFRSDRQKGVVRLERRIAGERTIDVQELQIDDDYEANDLNLTIQPYDRLAVPVDPKWYPQEVVQLTGAFLKPGSYALIQSGEKLSSLLKRSEGFQPESYPEGATFFRKLRRVVTVPGEEDSSMVNLENGTVWIADSTVQIGLDLKQALAGHKDYDVSLQHGDSLWVPRQMISVEVSGAVGAPSHVLWRKGEDPEYYIARAGGLTRQSDINHVFVIYANGEKATINHLPRDPDPGSKIVVPQRPAPKETDWLRVVASVASILASFAAVALAISKINSD